MAKKHYTNIIGYFAIIVAIITMAIAAILLYRHTVTLMTNDLRQKLTAIAITSSLQFDPADLEVLKTEEDWQKPQWGKVVKQLRKIRFYNQNILFAYIVRKSPLDESKIEFVSDSHSLNPYAKLDLNGDGAIDDADQLQWPGQEYAEPPEEIFAAYQNPTTSSELIYDQWGVEMVGYAPIKNDADKTIAVMAIDMKADDFNRITRQTFLPFLAFIIAMAGVLLILTSGIIRIWNKRVEIIEETDRQKDELLSIVSHQLATPVSSIKWYVEMLLDGDLGELKKEQKEHLSTVQSVTGDLSDLIGMILDVSRIQLGKMHVDKQDLELEKFFAEILSVITPKAREKNVSLVVNKPENLPVAKLDKRLTRMTIENLLSNAVKYTPSGKKVQLNVRIKDSILCVDIFDEGCGIPKSETSQVFQKLYRASNVRNKVEGNGFGLYVAKGGVVSQGGKIWFESEEDKGTKFYVRLPLN